MSKSLPDFELRLSVIPPENWRNNAGVTLSSNKDWRKIREKVLKRDGYTCNACGFRSLSYMEVHHKSGYWWDDDIDNLGTFCPLCHSCFHIGLAGIQNRGSLILLDHSRNKQSPFLDQKYLNRSILENMRAYKKKDKVLDVIWNKIKPFVKEDFGNDGLIELGNNLLSVIKNGKEKDVIPRADQNVMFFPHNNFSIFNYLCKR